MRRVYLLDLGRLEDEKYYIGGILRSQSEDKESIDQMGFLEVSEEMYEKYQKREIVPNDNPYNTIPSINTFEELIPIISFIMRIPNLIEVETDSEDKNITKFKVIRHIPLKELDQYIEENREELIERIKTFCPSELYHPLDDYEYIRSTMDEDSYQSSPSNSVIISKEGVVVTKTS